MLFNNNVLFFLNVYQVLKVSASASHLVTFPLAEVLPSTSKTSCPEEPPSTMVNWRLATGCWRYLSSTFGAYWEQFPKSLRWGETLCLRAGQRGGSEWEEPRGSGGPAPSGPYGRRCKPAGDPPGRRLATQRSGQCSPGPIFSCHFTLLTGITIDCSVSQLPGFLTSDIYGRVGWEAGGEGGYGLLRIAVYWSHHSHP